ncbi:MAG: JAB domain-containing protein [Bacteroidota bacterium]
MEELLEGKLTHTEVAAKLRGQADVLQKYIDAKLNAAISRQRPTARRMRIFNNMREDALRMERLQIILRALASAHQSNRILHYPHLEDIRNKKQVQTLLMIEAIEKYNWDISRYVQTEQETLEHMSIFSAHDWKNAYAQLQKLLSEFSDEKTGEKSEAQKNEKNEEEDMALLELQAQAELELLIMETEERKRKKEGLRGYKKIADRPIPEIKLSYKRDTNIFSERIVSSKDAYEVFKKLFEEGTIDLQEYFVVIFLNRSNRVIGYHILSKGGISGTIADVRLIFAAALKFPSSHIMMAHNHPSGELRPSEPDISLTRKVKEAGKLLDIELLDHLIISSTGYYSFTDEGLL